MARHRRPHKKRPGRTRGRIPQESHPRSASLKGDAIRLNRFIARSGLCSRREADKLIERGLVKLNGSVVTDMGVRVSASDEVVVNGKRIRPPRYEYLLLNKPADTITTVTDDRGRRTVMDFVSPDRFANMGLFPVGRLDRHTTGVLLLTNDGTLAHRLTHPKFEIEKLYRVTSPIPLSDSQIQKLRDGVLLEDGIAKVDRIEVLQEGGGKQVGISLHEGRNRQIRRMYDKIGSRVEKLDRVKYAGLSAEGLRRGKWRRLSDSEVTQLYRSVKL